MKSDTKIRVGIVGTGAIAKGTAKLLKRRNDMVLSGILTRRRGVIENLLVDSELVTNNPDKLFEKSDLILVSTGDPIYNTEIIIDAFKYNLPVLTMDADTQVLTGSWLMDRGVLSEGNGDQPGCLAVLKDEITEMGFQPLVYGNIKGFQNINPSKKDMLFWAERQGFSLSSVTSFTDGTKLQIEQCLVANGLGSDIEKTGLIGLETEDFENGAYKLGEIALNSNKIISDYIISKNSPPGVFIVSKHFPEFESELRTYKMGNGPFYLHYKPIHLCFFELCRDIKNLYYESKILLNNSSNPTVSVAAIAKRELHAGEFIEKGIGSFDVRGGAIKFSDKIDHIPIGLLSNARIKYDLEPGHLLTFDDVEIPDSVALSAWMEILKDKVTPPSRNIKANQKVNQFYN